jgi:tRNA(Glu) U13 pseudouridine synthase TruD
MKLGDFEGYLGEAAEQKDLAKQAIKDKKFDEAWGHLHQQKHYYQKHAIANNWKPLQFLVLDSVPHEDMANILRIEDKHKNALSHLSYTYKTHYSANRPLITLEKKLNAYFNRAYKSSDFNRFLSLLNHLQGDDFISIRDFVEVHFPMMPNLEDDELELSTDSQDISLVPEKNLNEINKKFSKESTVKSKKYQGVIYIEPKTKGEEKKYPEPKHLKTGTINYQTKDNGKLLGYPLSDWIIGGVVGFLILVVFIWLVS